MLAQPVLKDTKKCWIIREIKFNTDLQRLIISTNNRTQWIGEYEISNNPVLRHVLKIRITTAKSTSLSTVNAKMWMYFSILNPFCQPFYERVIDRFCPFVVDEALKSRIAFCKFLDSFVI